MGSLLLGLLSRQFWGGLSFRILAVIGCVCSGLEPDIDSCVQAANGLQHAALSELFDLVVQ